MAHQFESGFFVREPAWHGLGNVIDTAPTTADGLRMAGLDWKVRKELAYDQRGVVVDDLFLNVRDKDNKVLGTVGTKYKIVQPVEAMDFIDSLIGKDIQLDTAGSLYGGRVIWILAKAPQVDVLGDAIQPYVYVRTSFDGSSQTKAGTTATRIVCANTLDMAEKDCQRQFTVRHTTKLETRLAEAQRVMKLNKDYMAAFNAKAERYAKRKVTSAEFTMLVNEIFGVEDLMTPREKTNLMHLKGQFGQALRRPDLDNFKGTGWHIWNAMGDFASHVEPIRRTATTDDARWDSFMNGNEWLGKTERVLDELVAA